MNITTDKTYTSRDLTLVAYLVASGFQLDSYRQGAEGLMLFTFPDTNKLHEHISNFYCMTAMVNPSVYYNTLRSLKSMLRKDRQDDKGYENYGRQYRTAE